MSGHCERCGEQVCVCVEGITPSIFDVLLRCLPKSPYRDKFAWEIVKVEDTIKLLEQQLATVTASLELTQGLLICEQEENANLRQQREHDWAELTKLRSESEPVAFIKPDDFGRASLVWNELNRCVYMETITKKSNIPLYLHPQVPEGEVLVDAERWNWLEEQYGLHREVEITYVVDGYELEFTYDGNPTDGKKYHGETLREAIDKAMTTASKER